MESVSDPRRLVFLVHGRDRRVKTALVELLTSFDLRILEWEEAAAETGKGTPSTLEVVAAGMKLAHGVVVLFTPDDEARCKEQFLESNDQSFEKKLTGQARQNVIFEAGMALALNQDRTVLVRHGLVRDASDLHGINYVPIDDTEDRRLALGQRLRTARFAVNLDHNRWRRAGQFAASNEEAGGTADGDPTSQPEPPPAGPPATTVTTHETDVDHLLDWAHDPTARGKLERLVLGRVSETDKAVNQLDMLSVGSSTQLIDRYGVLRDLSTPVLTLLQVAVDTDPEIAERDLWQTALVRLLRIRKRIAKDPHSLVQAMPSRRVESSRHLPAMLALRTIGLSAILFEIDHPGPQQPPTGLWMKLGRLEWSDPNGADTRPRAALDVLDEHDVLDPQTVHTQDQSGRSYSMSRYARALLRPLFTDSCPADEEWEQLNDQFEYRRALLYASEGLQVPPMLAGGEQRWTTGGWVPEREFLANIDRAEADSPWAQITTSESFEALLEKVRASARRNMPM